MEMKKRISLELRDRSPAEVEVLVVEDCRSSDGGVEGLTEEYSELQELRMVNVGLSSLSRLPPLPKLRKLEVCDNTISGGLDTLAEKCPRLTHLNLSGNKITELSAIDGLQGLGSLQSLVLLSCGLSSVEGYRHRVMQRLPQLTYLDGYDQDHQQAPPSHGDDEAGPHDDDDDDDEDDEDEEEEDSEEDEEVGLSYLMKEGIQDEEDDGDYVEEEEEEEEEEEDEDGEVLGAAVQGEKRKRDAEDEGDDDDDE